MSQGSFEVMELVAGSKPMNGESGSMNGERGARVALVGTGASGGVGGDAVSGGEDIGK